MPYFPNYRLGALEGSSCDTLNNGTPPVANFGWQVVDTLQPLTLKFMDLSESALSWSWDFGDGNTSQDSCPVHTYTQAGVYEVCLQVGNGFGADTVCHEILLETSGTDVPSAGQELLVYPNPVGAVAHVFIPDGALAGGILLIYNALQQAVYSTRLWSSNLDINLESFTPGVYYAVFHGKGTRYYSKAIIIAR